MAGTQSRPYVLRARARAVDATRERILAEGRRALFSLPFDQVTLPLVAERSGVTVQTVRNHVDSKEGLLLAIGESLAAELGRGRATTAPLDTDGAVEQLLAEYDAYGLAASRLLAAADSSPAMATLAERGRKEHSAWLERVFGPRLPADAGARRSTLAALYAATDVGTWRLLHVDLGHSRDTTARALRVLVEGALAAP